MFGLRALFTDRRRALLLLAFLFGVLAVPVRAEAATFVVTSADDADDGSCDPAHCSLREAIHAANATPGPDTITFDIPGLGPHRILLCSPLPLLSDDATVLDGTTEPDYTGAPVVFIEPAFIPTGPPPITHLAPCNPPSWGLWLQGNDITVRGFAIGNFQYPSTYPPAAMAIRVKGGTNNLIELNYLGYDPSGQTFGNDYGLVLEAEGQRIRNNVIADSHTGIYAIAGHQTIQANKIGTDPSGNFAAGNSWFGIWLEAHADFNLIGGSTLGMGNLISGNGAGIEVRTDHNQILGNFIGTDLQGSASLPNNEGVSFNGGSYNMLGGTGTTDGNLISGNTYNGVGFKCSAERNEVYGNWIGTDASGSQPLGNEEGIILEGLANVVGGTGAGQGNLIAYNVHEGIVMSWPALKHRIIGNTITQNLRGVALRPAFGSWPIEIAISENSISQNTELGIDLDPLGVTPNDPGDMDMGPNTLLNFPVLNSPTTSNATGSACTHCTVEIFLADGDPTGYGEGETLVGRGSADAMGDFNITLSGVGQCAAVTSTAIDSAGNTSEFSPYQFADCMTLSLPVLGALGIAFVLLGSISASVIGRGDSRSAGYLAAAGAVGGGAIAMTLLALVLSLPGVRLRSFPEGEDTRGAAQVLPPCEHYLYVEEMQPVEDAIVMSEDAPSFQWSPGENLPAGQVRWRLDLRASDGSQQNQSTTENAMPLSGFPGLLDASGRFLWRLAGEQTGAEEGVWQPFCRPTRWHSFLLISSLPPSEPSESKESSPAPSKTPTPTPTPTSVSEKPVCAYLALMNSNCRSSDYKDSKVVDIVLEGESAELLALNPELSHGRFLTPNQKECWIWLGLMDGPGNPLETCEVSVVDPPPPPPTDTPVPPCSPDMDQESCEASGGTWFEGAAGAPECICP
jgi:CSLREA domain-containing protein